jgi:hypothetical protein
LFKELVPVDIKLGVETQQLGEIYVGVIKRALEIDTFSYGTAGAQLYFLGFIARAWTRKIHILQRSKIYSVPQTQISPKIQQKFIGSYRSRQRFLSRRVTDPQYVLRFMVILDLHERQGRFIDFQARAVIIIIYALRDSPLLIDKGPDRHSRKIGISRIHF